MKKYISLGKFDIKYFIIYIANIIIIVLIFTCASLSKIGVSTNNKTNMNIFLVLLSSYLGQSFCFIAEIISNKYLFKEEINNNKKNNKELNKNKSKLIIEYIFNDLSDRITFKDIIHISVISLIYLIVDFTKLIISSKLFIENPNEIVYNEHYYFFELFFLFIISICSYKIKYYKHQYYSIIILITLGLTRYVIKTIYNNLIYSLINLSFQIIVTFLNSFIFVYTKALMEFKFFSPYKACYVFGIINTIIVIILYIIISFIECPGDSLCKINYKKKTYFDNLLSIFEKYDIGNFIFLLIFSISYGALKLLYNIIINNYTVCHLFLIIQNEQICFDIGESKENNVNSFLTVLIAYSYVFEVLANLVFLEIIELNFWGLNTNIKRNIQKRANDEVFSSNEGGINLLDDIASIENDNEEEKEEEKEEKD